jgi:shikimate kinase
VILRRVGDVGSRPLLARANGATGVLGEIRTLLAERAPAYALAAHTIDTTALAIDQVVERVRVLVAGR